MNKFLDDWGWMIALALFIFALNYKPCRADGFDLDRPDNRIVITPLLPGTQAADVTQPQIIYQPQGDGTVDVYQTIPGTSARDPYAPSYRMEHPDYSPDYTPNY